MATIAKLEPHRSMYLRGFDRRGAAAALHSASAGRLHAVRLLVRPGRLRGGRFVRRRRRLRASVHLALPARLLPGRRDAGFRFDLDRLPESRELEVPFGGVGRAELRAAKRGRRRGDRDARHGGAAGYGRDGRRAGQLHVHRQRQPGGLRPRATCLPGQRDIRSGGACFGPGPRPSRSRSSNYLGTGYSHTITIGTQTYTHVQLATDGSGDIAIALAGPHQRAHRTRTPRRWSRRTT